MASKMIGISSITTGLLGSIGMVAPLDTPFSDLFRSYCMKFHSRHGRYPQIMIGTPFNLPKRLGPDNWTQTRHSAGELISIYDFEEGKKEKWLVTCADDGTVATSTPYVLRPEGHLIKFECKIENIEAVGVKAADVPPPPRRPLGEPKPPKVNDIHAALAKIREERAKDAII